MFFRHIFGFSVNLNMLSADVLLPFVKNEHFEEKYLYLPRGSIYNDLEIIRGLCDERKAKD